LYGALNVVTADTIFGKHEGQNVAMYVQRDYSPTERLRFVAGGRFDANHLDGIERVSQFNPKFGMTYSSSEFTTLRFSMGRGFRAPTVAEVYTTTEASGVVIVPNPNLREERSWSYEIGVTDIVNENLYTDVSLFRNEFWDLIEPTFRSDRNVHFDNITRARIQGFEAQVNLSLWDKKLFSQVGYTYLFPEDLSKGDILKYRPRHLLYISETLLLKPYQIGVDVRFISKVDRIDDELVTLGIIPQGDERVPIYVTDIRLGSEWTLGNVSMKTLLQVNNVFNYYYVELIGNIAPLRHYVLTVEAVL
jgi:outer membrane receptor protein involved in Fe transport